MAPTDNQTQIRGLPELPVGRTIWDITERLQENFRRVEAILNRIESNDEDAAVQIAAAAEIRQHIALAHKTLECAARLESVRNFESAIFQALDEAGVTVRRKVMDILNARQQATPAAGPEDPQ
jgi:uncharacterized membrane protein YccC